MQVPFRYLKTLTPRPGGERANIYVEQDVGSAAKKAVHAEQTPQPRTTAMGKFWVNGSSNMTTTAENEISAKGAEVGPKQVQAKPATGATALVTSMAALSAGASTASNRLGLEAVPAFFQAEALVTRGHRVPLAGRLAAVIFYL